LEETGDILFEAHVIIKSYLRPRAKTQLISYSSISGGAPRRTRGHNYYDLFIRKT
jgi:hypothetical protein